MIIRPRHWCSGSPHPRPILIPSGGTPRPPRIRIPLRHHHHCQRDSRLDVVLAHWPIHHAQPYQCRHCSRGSGGGTLQFPECPFPTWVKAGASAGVVASSPCPCLGGKGQQQQRQKQSHHCRGDAGEDKERTASFDHCTSAARQRKVHLLVAAGHGRQGQQGFWLLAAWKGTTLSTTATSANMSTVEKRGEDQKRESTSRVKLSRHLLLHTLLYEREMTS
jgi:hypothetical protein